MEAMNTVFALCREVVTLGGGTEGTSSIAFKDVVGLRVRSARTLSE